MAVPQNFPAQEDRDRIAQEKKYYELYKSIQFNEDEDLTKFMLQEFFANDKNKMKTLALALNIAPSIVRAGTNFLFGCDVKIEIDEASEGEGGDDDDTQEPDTPDNEGRETEPPLQARIDRIILNNDLQRRLKESSRMLQAIGHTQFKFRLGTAADGTPGAIIEEIPFDSWIPSFANLPVGADPTTFYVVSYIQATNADGTPGQKYIYVEEHTAGFIRYSLYFNVGGKIGQQVPLSTLANLVPTNGKQDTANSNTYVEETKLPFATVLQLDADKDVKDRLGESILKQIMPILNEINMRLTQISMQMLKHLDPLLEMPDNGVPRNADGTVNRKKLEIIFTQQGDVPSRYVTNDNAMIEEAFKHLDKLILRAAKLTDTPQGFIDQDDKGGVESAESIKTRFMLFLKRIENYRRIYANGIRAMIVRALKIEGVTVPDDAEFKITFDYGIPRDMEVDGRVWGQALLDGLASQETAIKNFQGIDGDLLDEEMARIKKDQALVPPVNLTQRPAAPQAA